MTIATDCPHCPAWLSTAHANRGRLVTCECGAEYYYPPQEQAEPRVMQRFAPGFPIGRPPSITAHVELDTWRWEPNVKDDMAAIAWTPGSNDRGMFDEDTIAAERRAERRGYRRLMGERRLQELRDWCEDGRRFADVLLALYVERGEVLNEGWRFAESKVEFVAKRFARLEEQEAFRARLRDRNPRLTRKQLDALVPMAIGSALVGAAESAYLCGASGPWALAQRWCPGRAPKKPTKIDFLERMATALAEAKARFGIA